MRRSLVSKCLLTFGVLLLVSWGKVGHQAIGNIAAAHLTPNTAQAIAALLGKETLADVSTYADEIREDSFLQSTGPWHYIDVPANENFDQFEVSVYSQTTPNLYKALLHFERELQDPRTNRSVKIFALKMLVHLVEDAHQPLHVARAEDKGGNTVAVKFEGEETNLHAIWDSKLIEHTKLSAAQLAKDWDFATPEDIKLWQADPMIHWLYESNHISNHIYQELPEGRDLGESYFPKYIPLVRQRIDQAGIRRAGILNQCFDSPFSSSNHSDTTICDRVADTKYLEASKITFLNIGGAYPNQKFSIVIKGNDRDKFKEPPEKIFAGKTICVTGSITMYKGRPEIVVSDPKQIVVKN